MAAGGSSGAFAGAFGVAGLSDSEGKKQREQTHTASLRSLLQRNEDWLLLDGAAGFL